jgi:hypothetical protein
MPQSTANYKARATMQSLNFKNSREKAETLVEKYWQKMLEIMGVKIAEKKVPRKQTAESFEFSPKSEALFEQIRKEKFDDAKEAEKSGRIFEKF